MRARVGTTVYVVIGSWSDPDAGDGTELVEVFASARAASRAAADYCRRTARGRLQRSGDLGWIKFPPRTQRDRKIT